MNCTSEQFEGFIFFLFFFFCSRILGTEFHREEELWRTLCAYTGWEHETGGVEVGEVQWLCGALNR